MNLDDYQKEAARTMSGHLDDPNQQLAVLGLGLTGEAGEAADIIKKHVGHGHVLDVNKLEKELGDVLWYVAATAAYMNVRLSSIAAKNIEKLQQRYPNGFSSAASIGRVHDADGYADESGLYPPTHKNFGCVVQSNNVAELKSKCAELETSQAELLDAAKAVVRWWSRYAAFSNTDSINRLRAAIAKAEGGQA